MMVWMYRCAARLYGHKDDAKDFVPDTFLNAFRRLNYFLGHPKLPLFLPRMKSQIAKSLALVTMGGNSGGRDRGELGHTVLVSAPPGNG